MGIKEHIVFPEINYDKIDRDLGHGHHRLHHGEDRRGGEGAAEGIQLPVPAVRPAAPSNAETQETRMAKKSSIEKNKRRRKMAQAVRRQARAS